MRGAPSCRRRDAETGILSQKSMGSEVLPRRLPADAPRGQQPAFGLKRKPGHLESGRWRWGRRRLRSPARGGELRVLGAPPAPSSLNNPPSVAFHTSQAEGIAALVSN